MNVKCNAHWKYPNGTLSKAERVKCGTEAAMAAGVPETTARQLAVYVVSGVPPSGFVRALLENDLVQTFSRADEEHRLAMFDIVKFVYNVVPVIMCGNKGNVDSWIDSNRREVGSGD